MRISDWSSDVCSSDLPDDDALVDAARRIAQDDVLAPLAARKIAGGEDVQTRDLELGGGDRPPVAAMPVGQPVRQAAAHVPQRRDQAIDIAVMLAALDRKSAV